MTYPLIQTILVAVIAAAVTFEVASSRYYRRRNLWLQTGNAKVGLLAEKRLRRLLSRDVVAVGGDLQQGKGEQEGGEHSFHTFSVNGGGDGA